MLHGIDKSVYGQQCFKVAPLGTIFLLTEFFFFYWCESYLDIGHHKRMSQRRETSICLKLLGPVVFNSSSWLLRKCFSKMQKQYLDYGKLDSQKSFKNIAWIFRKIRTKGKLLKRMGPISSRLFSFWHENKCSSINTTRHSWRKTIFITLAK